MTSQINDIRSGTTYKLRGSSPLYITINHDEAGVPLEVFINTTPSGTTVRALCEALGRVISIAIQHDTSLLAKITRTIRGIMSESNWMLGKQQINSIPDGVAVVMDLEVEKNGSAK